MGYVCTFYFSAYPVILVVPLRVSASNLPGFPWCKMSPYNAGREHLKSFFFVLFCLALEGSPCLCSLAVSWRLSGVTFSHLGHWGFLSATPGCVQTAFKGHSNSQRSHACDCYRPPWDSYLHRELVWFNLLFLFFPKALWKEDRLYFFHFHWSIVNLCCWFLLCSKVIQLHLCLYILFQYSFPLWFIMI